MDLQKIYSDSDFENAVVPEGQILVFNGTENGKPVTRYKDSSGNFGTIAGGGGTDVTLGQIDADGNFQPLAFNGTEASNNGNPETVENYYGWNGVLEVPDKGIKVGEATEYYKCASVDTTNKTWSGYLAVLTDGVYAFEESETTGLTCDQAYTPKVGGIYDASATMEIAKLWSGVVPIPTDGLIFYAPLSGQNATAETGQSLSYYGNITFETYKGIDAGHFNNAGIITEALASSIDGSGFTLSLYFACDNFATVGRGIIAHAGAWNDSYADEWWGVLPNGASGRLQYYSKGTEGIATQRENKKWYHLIYQQGNGTAKAFVNNVLDLEEDLSYNAAVNSGKQLSIGCISGTGSPYFNGYIAEVRLYNRVLDSEEITALYNSFTSSATE